LCLERHLLDVCEPGGWTQELLLLELKEAVILSKAEMPEIARERIVDVHHLPALRAGAIGIIYPEDIPEAIYFLTRSRIVQSALDIGETG
jgi:hypothetical protein